MKRSLYQMIGIGLLGVMFYSCEPSEEPFIENEVHAVTTAESKSASKAQEQDLPDYFLAQLAKFYTAKLNSYELEFLGRTVQGSGGSETTTFQYRLSGTGETPQLDSFNLSIPDCTEGDPVDWTPKQAVSLSENSIKWNQSVSKDGSQEYSVTFAGNVLPGVISSTVTRGSNVQSYDIVGPCAGVYTISGSIYIDASNYQTKDPSESGIPNISISLKDEKGVTIGTEKTSYDGSYSFTVLTGTYTISVGGDLLDDENYTANTPTSIDLGLVEEDKSNNNFGYLVETKKISEDLEAGNYNLNTEPTKFWVQQIRNAGKKNTFSEGKVDTLLTKVEGLLLEDPFQFGEDKRAAALDILTRPIKTDFDHFLQQLLTAELNYANGWGARYNKEDSTLNEGFNRAMLIYSEAVACRERKTCPTGGSSKATTGNQTKLVATNDIRMLLSFNGSGGI